MWVFLVVSTLAWGIAEIFYKKGNLAHEKYSHLKTTVYVGLFMGVYATIILFTQGVDLKAFPLNFVRYLPVAACYILSMILSYFGVRFLEESIADPIENTSCAIVPILCAIFLKQTLKLPVIIGILLVAIGLICVGIFDKKGKNDRTAKLGKKLAIIAIAMPFCYMLLDAVGTFLDIYYTESVENTFLVNVTEANIEHTANCAYELTFFLVAVGIAIFLKAKGENIFVPKKDEEKTTKESKIYKALAALFETVGQATYLFALSEGTGVAAVIMGSGTVIVSLILSRIFLKEKLSIIQYVFVAIILSGIIVLSVV
ncbi:MAG: EamA family transporter [Firmicutes bacterium]|nr:EamA family transporter [Candidatus Fiminaster equi]